MEREAKSELDGEKDFYLRNGSLCDERVVWVHSRAIVKHFGALESL